MIETETTLSNLRATLRGCRGQWRLLARRAKVSHGWISAVAAGTIRNPGVLTLERVRKALEGIKPE
jgi:hypothetical protein